MNLRLLFPLALVSSFTLALAQAPAAPATPATDDQKELLTAVLVGDVAKVRAVLARGVSPDFVDATKKGLTPLTAAVGKRQADLVEALLAAKADVNFPDGRGMTPLMHAARGDGALTERLLASGADHRARDKAGMSALLWSVSASQGHQTLPPLLLAGADPDDRQKDGVTPLMIAAKNGNEDVIRLLAHAKADLEATEPKRGLTALAAAIAAKQEGAVGALLAAGADANHAVQGGVTPLMLAVAAGDTQAAASLVKAHAEVKAQAEDGKTALAAAAAKGDAAMVDLLKAAGADR